MKKLIKVILNFYGFSGKSPSEKALDEAKNRADYNPDFEYHLR